MFLLYVDNLLNDENLNDENMEWVNNEYLELIVEDSLMQEQEYVVNVTINLSN